MPAATKKATPAKAAAKKAPAKATAPAKKAPAKKAAPVKATAKATDGGRDAKRLAEVKKLRDKDGMSIADIAAKQGRNAAIVGADYIFATEERAGVPITAARVKKDRDSGMGWVTIAARYSEKGQANVTKAQVQKLYREAGGDTSDKPVKKAAAKKEAPAKAAAAKKGVAKEAASTSPAEKRAAKRAAKQAAVADLKPIFTGEESKEEVVAKIEGKTITLNRAGIEGEVYKVGTVSAVGKSSKLGGRSVQYYDAHTGGARTHLLVDIVKVSR